MGRISLLAFVLLLVGIACGMGGQAAGEVKPTPAAAVESDSVTSPLETASTPIPAPTNAPFSTATPAKKIVDNATLLRLGPEPTTLDPHLTTDATSALYVVEIFGGLVTIDRDLQIVADLAEDWDISNEGRTYTFYIKEDAKFHDGRPVTAQDFKWSLERIADPATESLLVGSFLGDVVGFNDKLEGSAASVEGVQVINDRTLAITIDAPRAYFLAKLTHPSAFVLDRNNVEGNPDWIRNPNGTGPFRLSEYEVGDVLRLKRNELYHLGPPKLAEVNFLLSGGDALLMYENDEIHVTGVGLINLEVLGDPSHPLNQDLIQAPPSFDVSYFGMNFEEPPFDDVKVRQALNYAVDKATLSRVLLQGLVAPAHGILPPGFPGYDPGIRGYSFDPGKAMKLLEDSKYGDDLANFPRITLTLPGSFGAPVDPTIEAMLQMWRENLGIDMEILQTEWAIFVEDLNRKRFQMFGGLAWIADYMDPENFLDILFHSESENNHNKYSNPEVDSLLEKARGELNETVRFEIYHRVEQQILDDAPWIPLWHGTGGYVLLKPQVKDYSLFPMTIPRFRYVYITEE